MFISKTQMIMFIKTKKNIHTYACTLISANRKYTNTYTHAYIRMCIYIYVYIHVYIYIYVCICIYEHTHNHTHTNTRACTNTHTQYMSTSYTHVPPQCYPHTTYRSVIKITRVYHVIHSCGCICQTD